MITKELDHEDGELTATQKVKRSSLVERFAPLVDDMYGNRTEHAGGDLKSVHAPARSDDDAPAAGDQEVSV
jgi:long-chain acyl-CoA synthetase